MKIEELLRKIRNNEITTGDKLIIKDSDGDMFAEFDGAEIYINDMDYDLFTMFSLDYIMNNLEFIKYEGIEIGNLELRGANFSRTKVFSNIKDAETLEIVLTKGGNKITIGFWEKCEMGYDFKFVGDRFLKEDIDIYDLYELIEKGKKITQQMFKEKNNG